MKITDAEKKLCPFISHSRNGVAINMLCQTTGCMAWLPDSELLPNAERYIDPKGVHILYKQSTTHGRCLKLLKE